MSINRIIFVVGALLTLFWAGYLYECNSKKPVVDYVEITGGTFDIPIRIFITEDTAMVKRYEPDMNFNSQACTVYSDSTGEVSVWFPRIDTTLNSRLTVMHEMQHVTRFILSFVGLEHTAETDEVYSYELEYLVKQIYYNPNFK